MVAIISFEVCCLCAGDFLHHVLVQATFVLGSCGNLVFAFSASAGDFLAFADGTFFLHLYGLTGDGDFFL